MVSKRSILMKVDIDLKNLVQSAKKKTGKSMTEITRDIAHTIKLLDGKKKLKRSIVEEIDFG